MRKNLFLLLVLLLSAANLFAENGKVGSLNWTLENGTLTISGTGAIPDDDSRSALGAMPWKPYNEQIFQLILEEGVTGIGTRNFHSCYNLNFVSLPGSLTYIGLYAFRYCGNLTSIDIPAAVTSIEKSSLGDCSSLSYVAVHWDVPLSIDPLVFSDVSLAGVSLQVPDGTKSLYEAANVWKNFGTIIEESNADPCTRGATESLEWKICRPNNVLTVSGTGAMLNFTSTEKAPWAVYHSFIKAVEVENGVTNVGALAFANCENIASATLSSSLTTIGNSAFSGCGSLASISVPNSVTAIGDDAFSGCSSLASIDIPNVITTIGLRTFSGCSSLASIDIPNSVTAIGSSSFSGCSSLTSINIPNRVKSIGGTAFSGCDNLKSVNISGSVTSIGIMAFFGCSSLDSVTVQWKSPLSISPDIFAYVPVENVLLRVPEGTKALYEAAEVWKDFGTIEEYETPVETGSIPLGYCTDNITQSWGAGSGYNVEAAIVIPKEALKKYVGSSLTKILIGLGPDPATNMKVFIRNSLDKTQGYSQDVNLETSKWNEVTLNEAYEIPADKDIVIGYYYKSSTGNNVKSVGTDNSPVPSTNGDYVRLRQEDTGSFNPWKHISDDGYKNLCIVGVVEGNNMSLKDINLKSLSLFPFSAIDIDETFSIGGSIKNEGGKPVTDFEISYKTGGNEKTVKTFTGLNILPGKQFDFYIPDIDFEKTANNSYPVEVTVEKVNGDGDDYPEDNTKSSVVNVWSAPTASSHVSTEPLKKNLVLEEFTGVYCTACPQGHKAANEIKNENPGRASIINIHQGQFARATPDYSTQWGDAIAMQTNIWNYPAGTVNRHKFGSSMLLGPNQFKSNAATIMNQASYVNIDMKTTLDEASRELTVDVELYYTANGKAVNMLNIAMVQDSIIGYQSGGATFYPEMCPSYDNTKYQHNHMLRDLLTGQWGDSIKQTGSGTFIAKRYLYTIPEKIKDTPVNLNKIDIIAFVAEGTQEIITGCSTKAASSSGIFSPYVSHEITASITDGYLRINSDIPVQGADIYAVSGQKILSVSNIDEAIPVTSLPSGVYIVKVQTAEGEKTVKTVK
ncbi:MAG: leucine-rich repeat protein [Dysgonamonadaceae bacterium]|jgi:hypothetical protein|nr:leucine-rich repeat protein [Dysgonamonadaceae bacterium]